MRLAASESPVRRRVLTLLAVSAVAAGLAGCGNPGQPARDVFAVQPALMAPQTKTGGAVLVNIPALIELISSVMTLNPGDVIASGTPEGVGPIVPGDTICIGIESVGEMTLPVVEAAQFSPRRF